MTFCVRLALPSDVEAILSILVEVSDDIPTDLSRPRQRERMRNIICETSREQLSFVAVNSDGKIVGFQLAKKIRWFDSNYVELTYAGVTELEQGKHVFTQLLNKEPQMSDTTGDECARNQ
jgi:hypothetical protein